MHPLRILLLCLTGLLLHTQAVLASTDYQQGLRLLQRGYYTEARFYLEKARAQEPARPEILFSLGVLEYQLKNFPQAFQAYHQALSLLPEPQLKSQIIGALGDIYYQMQDYAQAINAYQQALFTLPHTQGIRLRLAICYFKQQNYAFAQAETERLLKDFPFMPEAIQLRSLIQLAQADYITAMENLEKSRQINPVQDLLRDTHLNWLYRVNRRYEAARTLAKDMIKQYSYAHPHVFLLAGDTAFDSLTGCIAEPLCPAQALALEAASYYEKYTLLEPKQALGHYKLGQLYLWQKAPQTAEVFFKRAEQLFPDYPSYRISRLETELMRLNPRKTPHLLSQFTLNPAQLLDLELLIKLKDAGVSVDMSIPSQPAPDLSAAEQGLWYFFRGYLAYQLHGQLDKGAADWYRAEQLAPTAASADLIRALRMQAAGQYMWARDLLYQALQKKPDWWLAHFLMGRLHKQLQQPSQALYHLDQAIRWNPLSYASFLEFFDMANPTSFTTLWQENLKYALRLYPEDSYFQMYYWKYLKQKTSF